MKRSAYHRNKTAVQGGDGAYPLKSLGQSPGCDGRHMQGSCQLPILYGLEMVLEISKWSWEGAQLCRQRIHLFRSRVLSSLSLGGKGWGLEEVSFLCPGCAKGFSAPAIRQWASFCFFPSSSPGFSTFGLSGLISWHSLSHLV